MAHCISQFPTTFAGIPTRMGGNAFVTPEGAGRIGPMSVESFYRQFTNLPQPPTTWQEWRSIPETFLSVCTNGEVFLDECGMFSRYRNALLEFYPEDVCRKKIAARCMDMAQSGQYNLVRSLQRGNTVAAFQCAARFAEQALSLVFLLNKHYVPFYKWAAKAAVSLPILGKEITETLEVLASIPFQEGEATIGVTQSTIERFCSQIAFELRNQSFSDASGNWLIEHGLSVQSRIIIPALRSMPAMLE